MAKKLAVAAITVFAISLVCRCGRARALIGAAVLIQTLLHATRHALFTTMANATTATKSNRNIICGFINLSRMIIFSLNQCMITPNLRVRQSCWSKIDLTHLQGPVPSPPRKPSRLPCALSLGRPKEVPPDFGEQPWLSILEGAGIVDGIAGKA